MIITEEKVQGIAKRTGAVIWLPFVGLALMAFALLCCSSVSIYLASFLTSIACVPSILGITYVFVRDREQKMTIQEKIGTIASFVIAIIGAFTIALICAIPVFGW